MTEKQYRIRVETDGNGISWYYPERLVKKMFGGFKWKSLHTYDLFGDSTPLGFTTEEEAREYLHSLTITITYLKHP